MSGELSPGTIYFRQHTALDAKGSCRFTMTYLHPSNTGSGQRPMWRSQTLNGVLQEWINAQLAADYRVSVAKDDPLPPVEESGT